MKKKSLKFIDLYAGLGGFHQALSKLGHECVWASEYNLNLRSLYKKNFPKTPIEGDIFKVDLDSIPEHDIICGGFPCQPFSRAGKMQGFEDLKKGNHFFKILEIIDSRKYKPTYIFLENVETILKHNNGETFKVIETELLSRGYEIDKKILSPHEFNIPHHRRRLFIVGALKLKQGLINFKYPEKHKKYTSTIEDIIDNEKKPLDGENLYLDNYKKLVLKTWKKFIESFPKNKKLPGFPIWSHEWGANYPFQKKTPFSSTLIELNGKKGAYGEKIIAKTKAKALDKFIPRYSKNKMNQFPKWKINFIKKNREFYLENKNYIDKFLKNNPELKSFEFSDQKFEWNCSDGSMSFEDKIIQFRPSGVRIKLNNWSPALTTIRTQNVYIPKIKRKLSLIEISKLQSMSLKFLPDIYNNKFIANGGYKAFGNAVNVELVKLIGENLFRVK
tara:strand:- start:8707 stop:10041 length:1335 start_codon:yes stop_codon:yes gene_type:complete